MRHILEIRGRDFYLDGKKTIIRSGAIHYFRVLPEYWENRLLKLKAAGLNTVETYVPWNLHEPKKGEFNFDGILDIVRFVKTAEKIGLNVIVRPGPYICAEWDFGGFPAWLLKDENIRLRCSDKKYLKAVTDYFNVLLPMLAPLQKTKDGPIIAMQIENEYGSFGNDKNYLSYLRGLMRSNGIDVLLFTSDGDNRYYLSGGGLEGELMVTNFNSMPADSFKDLRELQPDKPLMCGEYWCGWFEAWGGKHPKGSAEKLGEAIRQFFDLNASFNLYMFHGGTNFGFTSGANYYDKYTPTVTSYDYDAPLNEYGGYTDKYFAVREAIIEKTGESLPEPPAPPVLQRIGKVNLTETASLLNNIKRLGKKHRSVSPRSMEYYGQNHGLILYSTEIEGNYNDDKITIEGIHDKAFVWINGEFKGSFCRTDKTGRNEYSECFIVHFPAFSGKMRLDILVEAMGRVNYGNFIYDRKGIKNAKLGNQNLSDWLIYTLPLEDLSQIKFGNKDTQYPLFLRGSFKAETNADCFVDMKGFTKGIVWVNGFNLGRYWKIGPQRTLYLPGALLKEENEIIILELESSAKRSVEITDKPIYIK